MAIEQNILADEIEKFKSGVDIISWAAKNKVYRELLILCYIEEVRSGRMVRIENLDYETKEAIWEETKKDSALLDKKGCIQLSKIVYMVLLKIKEFNESNNKH